MIKVGKKYKIPPGEGVTNKSITRIGYTLVEILSIEDRIIIRLMTDYNFIRDGKQVTGPKGSTVPLRKEFIPYLIEFTELDEVLYGHL